MISGSIAAPDLPEYAANLDDGMLLDIVQRQTARYFWEGAHPVSGLARDRQRTTGDPPTTSWQLVVQASASWRLSWRSNEGGSTAPRRWAGCMGCLISWKAPRATTACFRISPMATPDRRSWVGQRDRALFTLLYNTGARVPSAPGMSAGSFCLLSRPASSSFSMSGKSRSVSKPKWDRKIFVVTYVSPHRRETNAALDELQSLGDRKGDCGAPVVIDGQFAFQGWRGSLQAVRALADAA